MSRKYVSETNLLPSINTIICNISERVLNDKIRDILGRCNLKVYGYNTLTDEYWGKKQSKNGELSFTLFIIKNTDNQSSIVFEFITSNNFCITNFVELFKKQVQNNTNSDELESLS